MRKRREPSAEAQAGVEAAELRVTKTSVDGDALQAEGTIEGHRVRVEWFTLMTKDWGSEMGGKKDRGPWTTFTVSVRGLRPPVGFFTRQVGKDAEPMLGAVVVDHPDGGAVEISSGSRSALERWLTPARVAAFQKAPPGIDLKKGKLICHAKGWIEGADLAPMVKRLADAAAGLASDI